MKRRELIRYLTSKGCELLREGGNHSWWHNPSQNRRSAVPRHTEISDEPARVLSSQLSLRLHFRACFTRVFLYLSAVK